MKTHTHTHTHTHTRKVHVQHTNSSANILAALDTWSLGGIIRDIIDVPFPLAASSRFISFLTFHISMFLSASVA